MKNVDTDLYILTWKDVHSMCLQKNRLYNHIHVCVLICNTPGWQDFEPVPVINLLPLSSKFMYFIACSA